MNRIQTLWQQIDDWYRTQNASHLLYAGASAAEITAAEQAMGMRFPDEVRQSLACHNGSAEYGSGWVYGELLSLARMQDERRIWMDLLEAGSFDDLAAFNHESGQITPGWWHPQWLPLDADGGGNGNFVDCLHGHVRVGFFHSAVRCSRTVGHSGKRRTGASAR